MNWPNYVLISGFFCLVPNIGSGQTVIESIDLKVDGSSIVSKTVLKKGVTYTIRASGKFTIGGPGDRQGDAEYADFSSPLKAGQDICGDASEVDFGVAIDNENLRDKEKGIKWGRFNKEHIYLIHFVGQGRPLLFNFHDCYFMDNSGTVLIEILDDLI